MDMRAVILEEMRSVAAENTRTLAPLEDSTTLMESGLDSLGFAILVARLEDATGLDPLSSPTLARYPTTLGELIALYESALV